MSAEGDRARVRRSARAVGLTVGIAAAAVIALGVGALVLVILLTSRPDVNHGEHSRPRGSGGDDLVVDVDRVLPWVLVLGALGVVVMAFVAWYAARRAVRPLARALEVQRSFVADASHELRTPLTTLSSRIQVLQRRYARGEPVDEPIGELRADVDAMAELLGDMLLAAETDGAAGPVGSCSLARAASVAARRLAPLAADAGVRVECTGVDVPVRLGEVAAARLAVALLDNALQHSPEGGLVTLETGEEPRFGTLRVRDRGRGIRGLAPARVFDRFARSAETGRRRGYGLGLALVREVTTRAGGTVEVESTGPEGTTFLLRLPRADL